MGGFTINGFGAADSYYPLKSVGQFYCNVCRKGQNFSVMELKRKVKILYIPTVSLYSKYAVVCDKCKIGYYIDESVKDAILKGKAVVTGLTENGPEITETQTDSDTFSSSQIGSAVAKEDKASDAAPKVTEATKLVQTTEEKAAEISKTVSEYKDSGKTEAFIPLAATKKCPSCGFSYVGEPEFCVICGEKFS